MPINNTEFNWFLSTFVQTGKYCYGNILAEHTIHAEGSADITNYVINIVDTNIVSGELYDEYKEYSSTKRTAQFTDNNDGTWNVQLINYLVIVKAAKYEKNIKAYPQPYVRLDNKNKNQE